MIKEKATKWSKFINEISNNFFFLGFGIIFFQIFRLFFIYIYSNEIGENINLNDFLKVILMGLRFDATVTSYFVVLPFLTTFILVPFNKLKFTIILRKIFQILFIISSSLIYIITINYYKEYNDQFNHFLFLGLYDDKKAVLETIISDYNPFINFLILLSVIILSYFILKYFENKNRIANLLLRFNNKSYKIILVFIMLALFVCSMRGSFGVRPAMRKWSYISKDFFLNKTIMNPFRALKYAIKDFKKLNKKHGKNPYGTVIENYSENNDISNLTVTDLITKYAKGSKIYIDKEKPKQIFLIVMESFDSWPLLDKYSELGVATNLKNIEKNGIRFTNFLPSANSTMNSLGAIITGVPYTGINISKIGALNKTYSSSIFNQFKKLGYETNFFYGGFLSWQNIGNFIRNQGVDNIYSAPDAGGKSDAGTWGIEDEKLFNLVLKTVKINKKSLNIILTTSYHPPYSVDIYKIGFPYKKKTDFSSKAQEFYQEKSISLKALGHLWYSDNVLGDFVLNAEKKFVNSLFGFTGDHYGRKFINSHPNLYERSSVPFILYGKGIDAKIDNTPGSHIDITPSLLEIIAPEKFQYFSFGRSLFSDFKNKIGFGRNSIITEMELHSFLKNSKIQNYNLNSKIETILDNAPKPEETF